MAIVDLIMPKLGESIMEATVLKWHKKPGDQVKLDETVLDIATDKVDSEVPSTVEGTVMEILFKENDVVPIGKVIARIDNNDGVHTAPVKTNDVVANTKPEEKFDEEHDELFPYVPPVTGYTPNGETNNRFYSPLVLNIANSEGIPLSELESLPGTGTDGRVTKKDILQYVSDRKAGRPFQPKQPLPGLQTTATAITETKPAPKPDTTVAPPVPQPEVSTAGSSGTMYGGNVEIIEMDRMRKLIAKHMVDSKHTSPHVTSFAEADVTNMVIWRDKVKKVFEQREGTKITFTPLFIECVTKVIKRFPYVNCSVDGDKIILKKDINIGMATALPSGNLIVPVIKNADYLNLVGLSKSVNTLAANARSNSLKSDDISGGTFTITNVGTFGSLMGTPIINQPQVAILAVGAIKKRAVVLETSEGDAIGIRHMMYLSLSYDHRVVDGSIGASFLTAVAKEFENWDLNREW